MDKLNDIDKNFQAMVSKEELDSLMERVAMSHDMKQVQARLDDMTKGHQFHSDSKNIEDKLFQIVKQLEQQVMQKTDDLQFTVTSLEEKLNQYIESSESEEKDSQAEQSE